MASQERSFAQAVGYYVPSALVILGFDITFAQNKPDKPVKADDVFINAYNSKIKPGK